MSSSKAHPDATAQSPLPYSAHRLTTILLATAGMATQWATLHSVTFFGTIFGHSLVANSESIWIVNTLATFSVFCLCLLFSRRIDSLLPRTWVYPGIGICICCGQICLLASTIIEMPAMVLYLGDILLAAGTTPLIIAWGEMYRFLDPRGEQIFTTLTGIVTSVVLYLIEVVLPDPVAMAVNVALPVASLTCLRHSFRAMLSLADRAAPQPGKKPSRPVALFYICIAVFSMPFNYLMSTSGIKAAMTNHGIWEMALAMVVVIMVCVALAEVAAERKGFLLSPISVLTLLSAAMIFHMVPIDPSGLTVPSLLFSGYYLLLAMVYLALGPIVATEDRHPMRIFSAAMVANVGGLILGTSMAQLGTIVRPSVASALVMALTYAILILGFALLANRTPGIFRINFYDRDAYSFEYVAPHPTDGPAASRDTTGNPSYVAALADHCDIIARRYQLSKREQQVLLELSRGKTIATIASDLVVSENTVKAHTKAVYRKLGIHTREELLAAVESA